MNSGYGALYEHFIDAERYVIEDRVVVSADFCKQTPYKMGSIVLVCIYRLDWRSACSRKPILYQADKTALLTYSWSRLGAKREQLGRLTDRIALVLSDCRREQERRCILSPSVHQNLNIRSTCSHALSVWQLFYPHFERVHPTHPSNIDMQASLNLPPTNYCDRIKLLPQEVKWGDRQTFLESKGYMLRPQTLQSKVVALPVPLTVYKWSYRWDHPMAGRTNVHIGPADPVTIGSTLGHLLCYQPANGTYIWYWFCWCWP